MAEYVSEDTSSGVGDPRPWPRSVGSWKGYALALAYTMLWLTLDAASNEYWYLPAGLRFAALWLLPLARWGWLLTAELLAQWLLVALRQGDSGWLLVLGGVLLPWACFALVVRLMRPRGAYAAPESPSRMGAVLLAMIVAALLSSMVHRAVLPGIPGAHFFEWIATWLSQSLLAFVGMLVLVPLAFQLASPRSPVNDRRHMFRDIGIYFLPLLVVLALLAALRASNVQYAFVLSVAPAMAMSFRHGWRGAALALGVGCLALGAAHHWIEFPVGAHAIQLFIAIAGSMMLLMGAAFESLMRLNAALVERNRQEMSVTAKLSMQAGELRQLGQRLARAREDEQARLAHELHDELGQVVTALATRLVLLSRKADDPELLAGLNTQRELVQRLASTLRNVVHGLRPPLLDRFGLEAALREGPIQRMLIDAGMDYSLRLSGPVMRLGEDAGSAIYRICQEAATNGVRHAMARTFRVSLDVDPTWDGSLEVHLRIEDDGIGFDATRVDAQERGSGLRGMRDRVLAFDGESRCETSATGTRHAIWFIDRAPRAAS